MVGSLCLYVAVLACVFASVSLFRPRWFTAVRSRRRAALLATVGALTLTAALFSPAPETRVTTPKARLDTFCSVYEFHEVHSVSIAASASRIYQELKAVTADFPDAGLATTARKPRAGHCSRFAAGCAYSPGRNKLWLFAVGRRAGPRAGPRCSRMVAH